jgi:membrane peptidoglycan carboxypeptidase
MLDAQRTAPLSAIRRPRDRARTPRGRRARRIGYVSIGLLVTAPAIAFVIGYLSFHVPTPADAVSRQVATLTYDDGRTIAKIVPSGGDRTEIPITRIPKLAQDAVLAAEDRGFFSNPGFDLTGIARALWNQLRGGDGGGSTITQQYVKNTLVGNAHSLWRKYQEIVIASKLSQRESKDQILDDYLNAIYFGRGAYGIQAAARTYFGVDAGRLDLSQAALLAALIQSPSQGDPALHPDHAAQRWNYVLDGMAGQGWITPAQRHAAQFPTTRPQQPLGNGYANDSRGLVVEAVTSELDQLGIDEQDLTHEGLRITTTLDPQIQQAAVDTARSRLAGQPDDLRTAIVSIDPLSGGIRAYYGGNDGVGLDYAQVLKQPGSTFKPFVLLAALLHNPPVGIGTVMSGEPIPGLHNADPGATCDRCTLKQAMTISNNVVYYTLARDIGPGSVADAAHLAGITEPLTDPTEGIALGNKEIIPLQLASAYATLAAGGTYQAPHLITKVVTSDNRVLYQASPTAQPRIPTRIARNVVEAMLDVAAHDGPHFPAVARSRPRAEPCNPGSRARTNDAWFAGFTPSLSTAVWVGTDHNDPIRTADGTPISGDDLPGRIWHGVVTAALASTPAQQFPPLDLIGQPVVDAPTATATTATTAPPLTPTTDPAEPSAPPPGANQAPSPPPAAPPTPPPLFPGLATQSDATEPHAADSATPPDSAQAPP